MTTDGPQAGRKGWRIEMGNWTFEAKDATREAILLRAAFVGKSNSGKSWTAMLTAIHLAEKLDLGPLYVIDSENGSALRYAKSPKTGHGFAFKHVPMPPDDYSPESYIAALDYCEGVGARIILIDGISQEWTDAPGSVLEQVDAITDAATAARAARAQPGDRAKAASAFSTGWAEMSPRHNVFVQRLLRCSAHLVATMRCKTAYEVDKSGNPKKVGLAPIQRPGVEYEFDLLFKMDDAILTVEKTRCDRLAPGTTHQRPGTEFAQLLVDWIEDTEQEPAKIPGGLAKFAVELAQDGGPTARLELLAKMRENRESMPVQTSALRLFDAAYAQPITATVAA